MPRNGKWLPSTSSPSAAYSAGAPVIGKWKNETPCCATQMSALLLSPRSVLWMSQISQLYPATVSVLPVFVIFGGYCGGSAVPADPCVGVGGFIALT